MLVVVAIKTREDGGISQESFAVLLILFIGIFVVVIVSSPEDELGPAENTSSKSDADTKSSTQSSESVLPDPLDEGFDSPLM
jgi:hypothetical protein